MSEEDRIQRNHEEDQGNYRDLKEHKEDRGNHEDHKEHKEDRGADSASIPETYRPLPPRTELVVREIIGAAIAVHRALGPGFLEPVYERALAIDLRLRNLNFEQQKSILIQYRGEIVYRHKIDLMVENSVIVEVKAVRRLRRIHQAQILSYQKASGCRVGLLMNFNVKIMIEGLRRFVR